MQNKAFSLVELSIVLVILGLLVGGVLSGQSLIHAAEIRAVVSEQSRYAVAVESFRDKYFAAPGDMPNATQFWGIAGGSGSDSTCGAVASTDAKTCNGNGNGIVQAGSGPVEEYRFWQHLANAGLIEGSYAGGYPMFPNYATGRLVPVSKWSHSYWDLITYSTITGNTTNFEIPAGTYLFLSYDATSPQQLIPADVWNIDTKTDDGRPNTGFLISAKGSVTYPCSTVVGVAPPGDAAGQYNLSFTGTACTIFYKFNS